MFTKGQFVNLLLNSHRYFVKFKEMHGDQF